MANNDDKDKYWYKDAIIYEVHVRSFYDSNGDGVGDLQGVIEKLDYLQFLGVNTIWLLPFFPSPLKDDGYDITDYRSVNPIYGSLTDFKQLLREAHKRDLKVMIELVLNHTSNEHEWFQKSRKAPPNSRWRNYYVWSDTPEKYQEARVIFQDFESSNWSWDPVANAYYWHRFYSHQPDLNYNHPDVKQEIYKIVDFWLKMGVDALRLDAVPYLFEKEGTNCENLAETHAFLRELRTYIDKHYTDRFLLAEANQWPDEAVSYFGMGDICQMAFHFPMMPRMYTAIEMEDRFPLIDILQQTPRIPDNCQWATFLRNHDELTLEMVTDEERDYMYRIYAEDPQMRVNVGIRRRFITLMKSDRRKVDLMFAMLFTLPGTPVIYYGDEIGMGDNIYLGDRNSVRTPMQWSGEVNAGFSKANPQRLYLPVVIDPEYSYQFINVELQLHNDQSLLWWIKRFLALRKRFKAFGRGTIEFLMPENHKVLAYLRNYQTEHLLIVANLSRFPQYVKLDLSQYKHYKMVELLGDSEFPEVKKARYGLSLQPYSFLIFSLEPMLSEHSFIKQHYQINEMEIDRKVTDVFTKAKWHMLETCLTHYIPHCNWFSAKLHKIYQVTIIEIIPLLEAPYYTQLVFLTVDFKEHKETFILLLSILEQPHTEKVDPKHIIARLNKKGETVLLIEGPAEPGLNLKLLQLLAKRRQMKGYQGTLVSQPTREFARLFQNQHAPNVHLINHEQSNTSLVFGDTGILKLFRRAEFGINPDVEICQFLMEETTFRHCPRVAATLTYAHNNKKMTVAVLDSYIANQTSAWNYTIDALKIFFETAQAKSVASAEDIVLPPTIFEKLSHDRPPEMHSLMGFYTSSLTVLAQRTLEMHLALATPSENPAFKTEPFSIFDQRALYQAIQTLARKTFNLISKKKRDFPTDVQMSLQEIVDKEEHVLELTRSLFIGNFNGCKLRCHNDYHLGQVLYTGNDFFIIDFEGEPDRSLSERRIKRSPLKDVACMLRSFHYAVNTLILEMNEPNVARQKILMRWGEYWYRWSTQVFLKTYLEQMLPTKLIPPVAETMQLLKLFMLEKVLYEIQYEINHRPNWLKMPCAGLLHLLGEKTPTPRAIA